MLVESVYRVCLLITQFKFLFLNCKRNPENLFQVSWRSINRPIFWLDVFCVKCLLSVVSFKMSQRWASKLWSEVTETLLKQVTSIFLTLMDHFRKIGRGDIWGVKPLICIWNELYRTFHCDFWCFIASFFFP